MRLRSRGLTEYCGPTRIEREAAVAVALPTLKPERWEGRRALFAAGLAALGVAAVASCGNSRADPQRLPAGAGTPVEFRAFDGLVLRGRRYGSGSRWAILVRGRERDSRNWSTLVRELTRQGFRVLEFDLRGIGASQGPASLERAPADVSAALRFASSNGASRLYVLGAGAEANAALVAAASHPVRALVALSPLGAHGRPPRSLPEETRAPKLIMIGSLDDGAARQADEVFRRSIGWALLDSTPVAAQGTALLESSWGEQVRERIVGFLLDYP